MKVSYRWLKDVAPDLTLGPEAVQERLAERGAPVEEALHLAEGLEGVVVARVVTAGRHPNADRLSLCTVDAGDGTEHPVVCGAPNVRSGALYPFAPVGTTLPGDVTIRKAKIRGEVSEGMLCSARELGLGTDHTGILELPAGLEPGTRFVDALALDDWRLDVEVTANRGDLLSHFGVARELAPRGDASLVLPAVGDATTLEALAGLELVGDPEEAAAAGTRVRIEAPDLCTRYLGAVVRGVRVGPSPVWLQARLRAAGARPINNVVDATNYVLLELGQPLHAFDLGKLEEGRIVVRRARAEEKSFRTLDGIERRTTTDMLMICDAARPVAIAGVMGGEDSEVTAGTTDVLLECALFEPKRIRATRRALGISTDASYRFERGVDPAGMERALRRALELILATAGGTLEPRVADCHPSPWSPLSVTLRLGRVERVLGVRFDEARVRALLEPLGFQIEDGGEAEAAASGREDVSLRVRVPGFRNADVRREIDLIEEIARTHGYDAFPSELGAYRPGTVPDHPLFRLEDELRRMLAERGLFEAQTPAFVPEGEGEVALQNPISQGEAALRSRLVPSLLRRVEHNFARGERDVRLFELATSFRAPEEAGGLPRETPHLAVAFTGRRAPGHWSGASEPLDVWDLVGLMEEVARRSGAGADVVPGANDAPWLHAVTSFVVLDRAGVQVGWGGRVTDEAVDAPAWAAPVWAFELALPGAPAPAAVPAYETLPPFPAVERDLALLVPEATPARRVHEEIRAAGGAHLVRVEVFDLYTGQGIPGGTRSLAYRLRFQSPERTLTDEEVDRAVGRVVTSLAEALDVRVRG